MPGQTPSRTRRLSILTFAERHFRWSAFASAEDRAAIVAQGFAHEHGREVNLTSLGELETGHP